MILQLSKNLFVWMWNCLKHIIPIAMQHQSRQLFGIIPFFIICDAQPAIISWFNFVIGHQSRMEDVDESIHVDNSQSESDCSFDESVWSLFDKTRQEEDGEIHQEQFEANVKRSLSEWPISCNIPRQHVSNLLKGLHDDANLTFLPVDSRTLLVSICLSIQCLLLYWVNI